MFGRKYRVHILIYRRRKQNIFDTRIYKRLRIKVRFSIPLDLYNQQIN